MADQDEMYSDGPDAPPPPEPSEKEGKDEGEQTGLLPKSFFGSKDLTPGKQCKVEIVKTYDDEVQVKYIAHKGDAAPEKETASEEAAPDEADAMYSDA